MAFANEVLDLSPETENATEAALAAARKKIANLEVALRTSRMIGTAIGILVERYKLSPDSAFALLVQASQHTHRKVHDIAIDLVYTGEIPTSAA